MDHRTKGITSST